ncbi:MAG: AsmA-like C-terminal region-containing protein [Planctomycetes bacterium]|nr:AsmA-like C-terminal region-containing protein [Planctomycetota bacterium]
MAGVVGAGVWLTRPARLARLAGSLLENATGTQVHIDSARIGLDGSIHLHGVALAAPGGDPAADRLFSADEVLVRHDVWSLLSGKFRAKSVVFIGSMLYLTEDATTGLFNVQRLKPLPKQGGGVPSIPEIFVREGMIRFGESDAGKYTELGTMAIGGNLTSSEAHPGVYQFMLRQVREGEVEGPALSGSFDVLRRTMDAKLDRFTLDQPQRDVLPRRLREWWDLLEPAGSFPTVSFGYDPDPAIGLHAVLELKNAQITLPYGEARSRMTGVSGRFTVNGEKVSVENLVGKIEEMNYVLNGSIHGMSADAPFSLTLRVDPLVLPEQPHYLLALPQAVQRGFKQLGPSGTFKALVLVERKTAGGHISYNGSVQLVQAHILYSRFEYPLQEVQGEILFNDDEVRVASMHGKGPTGASVTVSGTVRPPGDGAAVNMTVTAVDAPVDHFLRDALNPKQREVLDTFIDVDQHKRLIGMGLIQTSEQAKADADELAALGARRRAVETAPPVDREALKVIDARVAALKTRKEIPVFDLGGRISLTAEVTRPRGPQQKYSSKILVTSRGFNVLFRHWPYPLHLTEGRLIIQPDSVTAESIRANGLSGAAGQLSGAVTDIAPGRLFKPDLQIAGVGVPMDAFLIASIPEPQNRWLESLHLAGAVDASGVILRNEKGDIDFHIRTRMEDGRAQPYDGRYAIEHIKGRAVISRGLVQVESIEGVHGETKVGLTGSAKWIDGKPSVQINATADGLKLDDPVLDLVPPGGFAIDRAKQLFDTYKPTGTVDTAIDYHMEGDRTPVFSLTARPHEMSLMLRGKRLDLTDMGGTLSLTRERVTIDKLTAAYDTGRLTASGVYALGDKPELDMTLDARDKDFSATARAALPAYVARVIEGLELHGAYHLRDAHAHWNPAAEGDALTFTGAVDLTDTRATLGVPITELNGRLDVAVTSAKEAKWPRLELRLDAQRLRAVGRLISPLSVRIASAADPSILDVRELRGEVYDGQLMGEGGVNLAEGGRYHMAMTLQGARLDPVVHPDKYLGPAVEGNPQTQPSSMPVPTGVLSAQLNIEGVPNDRRALSGRGQVDVRNANASELPAAPGILQVLNLSWPSSRAFDRASAQFVLDGDNVRFDSVTMEAPSLNIVGTGTMKYSTRALDLSLFTRNPNPVELGPIAEIVAGVKDQFVNIHVTGTLENPQTSLRSFTGVRDSWRGVFGPGKPAPVQPLTNGEESKSGQ